ncbi:MAG: PAS domain-containing protein [Pirellulales bacterium]|nr:PAS domain-containing protein [Pirellulales bacterium]
MLDCLPVMVMTIDRQGVILSVNHTTTGEPPANVIGHSCFDFLPEATRYEFRRALDAAFRAGQHTRFETLAADGRWWESRFAPVPPGRSAAMGVLVVNDVTEFKRAEQRARSRLAELAHVHRVHTMGTMAAELAHEINQPLFAIANYAKAGARLVRDGRRGRREELLTWLDQIAEQANRAGAIVRRLGRLARKGQPERVKTNLNEVIAEVVELTRPHMRRSDVDVVFRPAGRLPRVVADPVQIEQVVVNLMQNAIEAIIAFGAKERRLLIATSRDGNTAVRVTISDTAAAALPDDLEVLFEPFFTTKPEGMGMGLAISRSIVEDHGGWIRASRCDGGGSTFTFTLPRGEKETRRV